MKTRAKIMGLLMTMALALSVPVVYADNGNGGEYGWKHHGHGGLNLTDDQRKQLKDIRQKQRETMKATFEQLKANREALNKELIQAKPDMNKINGLQAQLKTLKAQMADNRLNATLEVKKILTPEQFGKYLEFQKHRFHRGEWGRGGRHRHCGFRGHCRHHHGYGYQHDGDHNGND